MLMAYLPYVAYIMLSEECTLFYQSLLMFCKQGHHDFSIGDNSQKSALTMVANSWYFELVSADHGYFFLCHHPSKNPSNIFIEYLTFVQAPSASVPIKSLAGLNVTCELEHDQLK